MSEEILQKGDPTEQPSSSDSPEETSGPAGPEAQVKDLQQKLDAAQKLAETYKDQLLRKAAEFDNYKKRAEADYATMVKYARESLITSLIPILDDLSRSLKSGRDGKDLDSFYKGVELIYNKFVKLLESHGLAPFDSVGKPFDVNYHDALLQAPRADVPPHTVVEEIERGYRLFDKIVKHAKVIVSAEQPGTSSAGDSQKAGND